MPSPRSVAKRSAESTLTGKKAEENMKRRKEPPPAQPSGGGRIIAVTQIVLLAGLVLLECWNARQNHIVTNGIRKEWRINAEELTDQAIRQLWSDRRGFVGSSLPDDDESSYRALQLAERALIYDPNSARAKRAILIALAALGEMDEAETLARRAISERPFCFREYCNLGSLLLVLERFAESEDAFATAVELEPTCVSCRVGLAKAQYEQGDLNEAEIEYRRVLQADAWNAEAAFGLGLVFDKRGNKAEAEKHFRSAIQFHSDFGEVHEYLGGLLFVQQRYTESAMLLCNAAELRGQSFGSQDRLTAALRNAGSESCPDVAG